MSIDLLTKRNVMARLQISLQTVDRLRKRGLLAWLNVGTGKKPIVRFLPDNVAHFEALARRGGKNEIE
jgi:hypothetical protein